MREGTRSAGRRRVGLWLMVALTVAEGGARLWEAATRKATGSLYDLVESRGESFRLKPGSCVLTRSRYGRLIEYRINSLGYRGDEPAPDPRGSRVVVLGDSVAFGLGVAWPDAFPHLLEIDLSAAAPDTEVVSLATFAYNTGDELTAWRSEGQKLRPLVVVVQFYMNDLELGPPMDAGSERSASLSERLQASSNRLLVKSTAYRLVSAGVQRAGYLLFHEFRRTHPALLNDGEPRRFVAYLEARPRDEDVPSFQALGELVAEIRRAGATPVVVISPNETELYTEEFDLIQRRVVDACRRSGAQALDLTPHLRKAPDRGELFLDGVHLSPRGHRLVAAELGRELLPILRPTKPGTS